MYKVHIYDNLIHKTSCPKIVLLTNCVPAMLWNVVKIWQKYVSYLDKLPFHRRSRIGVVSRANEGAHVHLPKPSRGRPPPLNATYLTGHCSILLVFFNHAHETALSAEPIVDKEFYQMRDQSAPLMQPISLLLHPILPVYAIFVSNYWPWYDTGSRYWTEHQSVDRKSKKKLATFPIDFFRGITKVW